MITDVGKVREVDEDSILAADLSFGINSENNQAVVDFGEVGINTGSLGTVGVSSVGGNSVNLT